MYSGDLNILYGLAHIFKFDSLFFFNFFIAKGVLKFKVVKGIGKKVYLCIFAPQNKDGGNPIILKSKKTMGYW